MSQDNIIQSLIKYDWVFQEVVNAEVFLYKGSSKFSIETDLLPLLLMRIAEDRNSSFIVLGGLLQMTPMNWSFIRRNVIDFEFLTKDASPFMYKILELEEDRLLVRRITY